MIALGLPAIKRYHQCLTESVVGNLLKRSVKTYSVLTTLFYVARNSQQWLWTLTMEGRLAVVQGGLEMSIQVTVEMDLSEKIDSALTSTRL